MDQKNKGSPRGRHAYIYGKEKKFAENDPNWEISHIEDGQVMMWIINFGFNNIQSLILIKESARDI